MARPVSPTSPDAAAISAQQAATASQRAAESNSTVVAQSAASNAAQNANVVQSPVNNGAMAVNTGAAVTSPRTDATLSTATSETTEAQANRPLVDGAHVETHPGISTPSTAQSAGQSTNSAVDSQIAVGLNTAEITADIRNVSATTREALFRQIDAKIDTSAAALRAVRRNRVELRGEARTQANESFKTVRTREQALRRSLKEARRASPDTAATAQAKLAADYQAYADAVVSAASTAHGSVHPTNP